ncbi:MAG: hypothetical protein ACYDGR_16660, partial [Candidatus Dormibacteria bacterium]
FVVSDPGDTSGPWRTPYRAGDVTIIGGSTEYVCFTSMRGAGAFNVITRSFEEEKEATRHCG